MAIEPDALISDGNTKVVFATTIADVNNPTVAEVTAVSAIDLSCLITGDGYKPSVTENTVSDVRLCTRVQFERRGNVTYGLELTYVRAEDSDEDLAFSTLVPGTQGFLIVREGKPFEDALIATDVVSVYPVEAGIRRQTQPTMNTPIKRDQKLFVRATPGIDVPVHS